MTDQPTPVIYPVLDIARSIPQYVLYKRLPTELDFNHPDTPSIPHDDRGNRPIKLDMKPAGFYNMLCFWAAIQSYWYYVLGCPQTTNLEFNYIKGVLGLMESRFWRTILPAGAVPDGSNYDTFMEKYGRQDCPSPTLIGRNQWNHVKEEYPMDIRGMFNTGKYYGTPGCEDSEQTWYFLVYGKYARDQARKTFGVDELRQIQASLAKVKANASKMKFVKHRS